MNLETERLHLRELCQDDIPDLHNMRCFPEVAQYNTIGIPASLEDTQKQIQDILDDQKKEKRIAYSWAIKLKKSNQFIGDIGLNIGTEKYKKGEIYYGLRPDHWGKGFATEANKVVLGFCFKTLKLHRIEAGVDTRNIKSIALLERLGFIREGMGRKILPIGGEWKDNYMYSLLEDEY